MKALLHEQLAVCKEHARLARLRAETAITRREQAEYSHLERHWLALVERLDTAVRISEMLEWSAQRACHRTLAE